MQQIGDRYRILERLGVGGMGEVYLGEHIHDQSPIVIKCLKDVDDDDETALVRFGDEARIMARLRHPNIVKTHEFFEHNETHYLILEYVQGETISELARIMNAVGKSLPPPVILRAAVETADALACAHRHTDASGRAMGIVHRDVSPQNIMLTRDGRAKLLDFGIAKSSLNRHVTAVHTVTGKASYMSPEQARCLPLDGRSDQFALGILIYELFARMTVFGGTDLLSILRRVAQCRFPPLHQFCPSLPRQISAVLARATHLRPENRYPSCEEFAQALSACLHEVGGHWTDSEYREWHREYETLVADGTKPKRFSEMREQDMATSLLDGSAPVAPMSRANSFNLSAPLLADKRAQIAQEDQLSVSTNIPSLDDGLVGRDAEVDEVIHQLKIGRSLISLLGPGGIGKTRLSQTIGLRHVGLCPGGVWFCDLSAALSPTDIVTTLADVLGFNLSSGKPDDQIAQMLAHLPPALIILDNFEQVVEDASATIGRWLDEAPQLQFLVTTRVKLQLDGEYTCTLGPLSLADGIQLFIQRGHENGGLAAAEEAHILAQSIVEHLDGLPLAIELAAARLQDGTLDALERQIHKRFRVLSDETQGRHERHSTLWAAIEWSWNLLDHELRSALACCSLFPTDFELKAASAVCGLSERKMRRVFKGLYNSSLLMTREDDDGGQRYYLLETVQEFARLQLGTTSGEACDRFIRFYAAYGRTDSLARIDGPGGAKLYQELRLEIPSLRAALRQAMASKQNENQAMIAFTLARLSLVMWQNPLGAEALDALELALPQELALRATYFKTKLLAMAGRREAASESCAAGLKQAAALGESTLALRLEVFETIRLGNPLAAENRKKAIELCMELRPDVHPMSYANLLAHSAFVSTDIDFTATAYKRSIAVAKEFGLEILEPKVLSDYANFLQGECRELEAVQLYKEAVRLCQDRALKARELNTIGNLANSLWALGRLNEADTLFRRLARKTAQTGHLLLRSFALIGYSQVLTDMGQLDEALRVTDEAERIATTVSWPRFVAHAQGSRGYVHFLNGDLDRAEVDLMSAVTRLESIRITDTAIHYPFLVEIAGRQQRFDDAGRYLEKLEALPLNDTQRVSVLTSEYVLRCHEGQLERAHQVATEIKQLIVRLGVDHEHYLNRRLAEAEERIRVHCR